MILLSSARKGTLNAVDYVDFCLEVRSLSSTRCRVSVRSLRGDYDGEVDLPLSLDALSAARARLHGDALRSARTPQETVAPDRASADRDLCPETPKVDASAFGRSLYDAFLQGPFAELFAANREHARQSGRGVRIKLVMPDAQCALVPWELLCSHRGDFLSLSEATPIVRYVLVGKPQASLRIEPPLRILGILSARGATPLDLGLERSKISSEIAPLCQKGLAEIEWLEDPTSQDLLEALDRKEWHIVHFAGHGTFDSRTSQGLISMALEGGGQGQMRANDLRVLLRDRPSVRLVFLNSCDGAVSAAHELFSSTAALVAEAGIPAVVAMQLPISDKVAIHFAQRVYRQIAAGASLEKAITQGRKDIYISGSLEWATPVLFMRPAEGAILQLDHQGLPSASATYLAKAPTRALKIGGVALAALAAAAIVHLRRPSDQSSSPAATATPAPIQHPTDPVSPPPGPPPAPAQTATADPTPREQPRQPAQQTPASSRPAPAPEHVSPVQDAATEKPPQAAAAEDPARAAALKKIDNEIQRKEQSQLEACSKLTDAPIARDACMTDYAKEIAKLKEMRRALGLHAPD